MFEAPERWSSFLGHSVRQSLVTALYAKEVASACGANVDSAFLTGLLHRVGLPVVLSILRRLEKHHDTKLRLEEVEATLEIYHAEVAAQLASRWGLANDVVTAIRHQDDWPGLDEIPPGAPLVSLAAALARAAVSEHGSDPDVLRNHRALVVLCLDCRKTDKLLEMSERIVEMANALR